VLPHPSHKNKDVARMGHPNIVGIYLPKQYCSGRYKGMSGGFFLKKNSSGMSFLHSK